MAFPTAPLLVNHFREAKGRAMLAKLAKTFPPQYIPAASFLALLIGERDNGWASLGMTETAFLTGYSSLKRCRLLSQKLLPVAWFELVSIITVSNSQPSVAWQLSHR